MFRWYIGDKLREQSAIFVDYRLHYFCTVLYIVDTFCNLNYSSFVVHVYIHSFIYQSIYECCKLIKLAESCFHPPPSHLVVQLNVSIRDKMYYLLQNRANSVFIFWSSVDMVLTRNNYCTSFRPGGWPLMMLFHWKCYHFRATVNALRWASDYKNPRFYKSISRHCWQRAFLGIS